MSQFPIPSGAPGRARFITRAAQCLALALLGQGAWAQSTVDCSALASWDAARAYSAGASVQEAGSAFKAKWWTQGAKPSDNSSAWAVWQNLGSCASGGGTGGGTTVVAAFTPSPQGLTVSFDGKASTGASSWSWNFGDGTTGTGVSLSHRFNAPGTYAVTLTVKDAAGKTASTSQSVLVSTVYKDAKTGKYTMTSADIAATEASLTNFPLFKQVQASIATRGNEVVTAVAPGKAGNPDNVKRVERILPEAKWNELFPLRNPSYTYTGLLQAIAKFSGVCMTYADGRDSEAICRKTLATMFAHFTQETGAHDPNSPVPQWKQALYFVRESGCSEDTYGCPYNNECNPSTWQGQSWPCGKDAKGQYKQYFGRGAKQLSYNYNYGPFSDAMYGDVTVLLNKPELVADTWLNLASAVFFYVYPASPKPSMLHVVDGTWQPNAVDTAAGIKPGFGATTNVINGGIECGQGAEKPQSVNRIEYYKQHAAALGVPIAASEELGCKSQGRFAVGGAGALNIYWDQDWSYQANMPEGKSFACKLVGYQTAYFALKGGDYQRCVQKFFGVDVVGGAAVKPVAPAQPAKPLR